MNRALLMSAVLISSSTAHDQKRRKSFLLERALFQYGGAV